MVPVRTGLDSTSALIDSMKRTLAEADLLAIRNDEQVPEGVVEGIRSQFQSLCDSLNAELGDGSEASPELKAELGDRVQREILPYMMLTKNGERWYSKPRGYAGDFLSIEWMYQDRAEGVGRLGPVLDRCFLDVAAAKAVRNRRGLLVEEIQKTMSETEAGRPTRVLSMACGPAREIFDTYATLSDPNQLHATCLDIDLQALAFVADVRDKRKLKRHIRLENANLAYLVTGRQRMELQPLDLAYSIGLIDYFNDEFVVRLLDFIHDQLRPGGRVILGNFHPRNTSKAFMDYVLDWKLIHRDEADMNRLSRRRSSAPTARRSGSRRRASTCSHRPPRRRRDPLSRRG
jgi:SAM-dependent methyltransferase